MIFAQRYFFFLCLSACLGALLYASSVYSEEEGKEKPLVVTPETSVATAFMVSPGYLVTAHHAVRGKQKIYVSNDRNGVFTAARVIGFSEDLDVAILQSSLKGPSLQIGHWSTFPRGAETYVIGFPKIGSLVSEKRITTGIFNGDQRFGGREDWFQLSAEIHRGNSGSPVIGADGKVYGLISHKLDAQQVIQKYGDFPQNVNFALKSSRLLEFFDAYNITVSSGPFQEDTEYRPFQVFADFEDSIYLLLGTGS